MRRGTILTLTVTTAVLLLAGCGATPAPAPTTVTVPAPAPAAPGAASSDPTGAPKTVTLPDVIGQNGAIAQDALRTLGLTKVDLAADPTSGKEVVLNPANWHVTKIEPKAGTQVRTDQTVVVTMTK
ncbi:MAG: PASTA domain-containing protein [Pseudonocardiaceae bacterium]